MTRIFKEPMIAGLTAAILLGLGTTAAMAGQPEPWQLGFQKAATPIMEQVNGLHNYLLWVITAISLFVLGLLVWVVVRYNRRANAQASSFSHNTTVEIVWTLVPVLILATIALPSWRLMYFQDQMPDVDMTIKATGYQWYWGYTYPDQELDEFFSNMIPEDEATTSTDYFGDPNVYRLSVDYDVVVPVGKTVRLIVTAADVLHNFAMPSFGIKMDAVPGRLNETWFRVDEPGMYYGQCSEICGPRHAFMPIAIRAVNEAEFDKWVREQKALAAGDMPVDGDTVLAAAR
ncbi:MAG: cytochrome c oxidase subunit II [Alphaproteobacteria bacterium]